tara:strand:- start:706 stop:846 length:141 start_codon:yes stop_codon:yes gene_type:complete
MEVCGGQIEGILYGGLIAQIFFLGGLAVFFKKRDDKKRKEKESISL